MAEGGDKSTTKFAQSSNFHSISYHAEIGRVKNERCQLPSSQPLQGGMDLNIDESKITSNLIDFGSGYNILDRDTTLNELGRLSDKDGGHDSKFKKAKFIPPALDIPSQYSAAINHLPSPSNLSWLTDLAIIATSPQSPLMQATCQGYAKKDDILARDDKKIRKSTSDVVSTGHTSHRPMIDSRGEGDEDDTTVSPCWLCFMKGTKIKFLASRQQLPWISAEELGKNENLVRQLGRIDGPAKYAPFGLKLAESKVVKGGADKRKRKNILILQFVPTVNGQPRILARCPTEHPFYVKGKGWSSFCPEVTKVQYGVSCKFLEYNDVCIPPPSNAEAFKFDSLNLTPMDSSAALTLSRMAKRYKSEDSPLDSPSDNNGSSSSVGQQSKAQSDRAKRPMNAFMLFAKKYRVQITQAYPGKDNRAISVILGDKWKQMESAERQQYAEKAKILAEEHKKNFPDCWKRKKTLKVTQYWCGMCAVRHS